MQQALPTVDADTFMRAYAIFNGTQNETDVIKAAGVLLSRQDVMAFLAGGAGAAIDAELVLCAVLFEGHGAFVRPYAQGCGLS